MNDDAAKQNAHAFQLKTERKLMDNLGVSRSQARKALSEFAANRRLETFLEANKPKPQALAPPKVEVGVPVKLDPVPLPQARQAENGNQQRALFPNKIALTFCNRDADPVTNRTVEFLTYETP